jgi:hypothetical protein
MEMARDRQDFQARLFLPAGTRCAEQIMTSYCREHLTVLIIAAMSLGFIVKMLLPLQLPDDRQAKEAISPNARLTDLIREVRD